MVSIIIKLGLFIVIVLVGLNIFNPEKADELVNVISEQTGIDSDVIEKKVDSATEFVIESSEAVVEIAKEKIKEDN